MNSTSTSQWFGENFKQLHPALQNLHRNGGRLSGIVTIVQGRGLAQWFGKRLAKKLGIPTDCAQCEFEVEIRHSEAGLHWMRRFGTGQQMASQFIPVGSWSDGYWIERSGPITLNLGVDVIDGGWYWRVLAVKYRGIPVPGFMLPSSRAYKRMENGQYRFAVEFGLPLLGAIIGYQGGLDMKFPVAQSTTSSSSICPSQAQVIVFSRRGSCCFYNTDCLLLKISTYKSRAMN